MLLLFKPAVAATQANLGLNLGLSGTTGISATIGFTVDVVAPTSIELMVVDIQDIRIGLVGISSGFLSRTANLTLNADMTARGGYGANASLSTQYGLSGTVGSFFDGIGSLGITFGISGDGGSRASASSIGMVLGLAGAPTISGGTLNASANVSTIFALSGAAGMTERASIAMHYEITGVGTGSVAPPPPSPTINHIRFDAEPDHITFKT